MQKGLQPGPQPETYEEVMVLNPHTKKPFLVTVLHCVKDVGLPLVAFGGVLLLLGSLRLIVFKRRNSSGESRMAVEDGLMGRLSGMWQGQKTPGWLVFAVRALYAFLFLTVAVALVPRSTVATSVAFVRPGVVATDIVAGITAAGMPSLKTQIFMLVPQPLLPRSAG